MTTNTVLAEGRELIELIPQRAPMVMIHRLISCNEKQTESSLFISEDNIFTENGHFSAPGMVENIAQTAAAGVGYTCKKENVPVPIGYIGAVKNLAIYFLPETGTDIHTEISIAHQVFEVTVINGTVRTSKGIAAQCEMKIFIRRQNPAE